MSNSQFLSPLGEKASSFLSLANELNDQSFKSPFDDLCIGADFSIDFDKLLCTDELLNSRESLKSCESCFSSTPEKVHHSRRNYHGHKKAAKVNAVSSGSKKPARKHSVAKRLPKDLMPQGSLSRLGRSSAVASEKPPGPHNIARNKIYHHSSATSPRQTRQQEQWKPPVRNRITYRPLPPPRKLLSATGPPFRAPVTEHPLNRPPIECGERHSIYGNTKVPIMSGPSRVASVEHKNRHLLINTNGFPGRPNGETSTSMQYLLPTKPKADVDLTLEHASKAALWVNAYLAGDVSYIPSELKSYANCRALDKVEQCRNAGVPQQRLDLRDISHRLPPRPIRKNSYALQKRNAEHLRPTQALSSINVKKVDADYFNPSSQILWVGAIVALIVTLLLLRACRVRAAQNRNSTKFKLLSSSAAER